MPVKMFCEKRLGKLLRRLRGDDMNEKELLKELIDKPKQPNVSEWVYSDESDLKNKLIARL